MKNLSLAIAAVAMVLAFVLFWDRLPDLFGAREPHRGALLPTADSYMRATQTHKFDAQGRLSYHLTTDHSEYFESRDEVLMAEPRLLANGNPGAAPWHLKAATGVLHNADRRVELHDNVVVWRDGPQGRNELRTSKLVYLPDARRVQTDQPVKLISPTSTTDGVGLDGDLERQTYRLLAQVRSVHQPR